VGQWLKRRLASRGRTLLNPSIVGLETFLWNALEPDPGERILRVEALRHAVSRCLEPALLDRSAFEEPARYLRRGGGSIDPGRRAQLAREMARLFLEYEYNRPSVHDGDRWVRDGIDRRWPDRTWFGEDADAPGEAWQRNLHGAVFGPEGPLAVSGWLGLPRLHRLRREAGRETSGGPAFLLSVDKTSHFHRNLLLEISRRRDLHLFLVNPCMEFWEDLDTSRRRIRRKPSPLPFRRLTGDDYLSPELPAGFWAPETDPPLLRLWGRTARENTVLWSQAADHDFEDHSVDPLDEDASLLRSLQSCLLRRDPGPLLAPARGIPLPDDGSLRILAAPEPLREWEAVRDAVLQWLSEDPRRRPSDAVVLLPDPEARIHEIESVFGSLPPGDPGRLPWAVLGARGGSSTWSSGSRLLWELWKEGLDRGRVLSLSRNPLALRRRCLTESDIAPWSRWISGTGTLSAWDRAERISRGESPDLASEAHTFRAGILRLAAAALTDEPIDLGWPSAGGPTPPWRDRDASDPQALDRFLSFCDDLHRDLEGPPDGSLQAMARRFLSLCDAWLDPSGDAVEEARRREFADAVEALGLRGPDAVDPAEFGEVLESLLDAELPGSSSAFGGALTFVPLRPGHVLPHGLVVVAGLDESFPGEPRTGSLDLLQRHRILGDPDPVADNRHAFLLALLSARERLVLSWTARDLRKDVVRPPSAVVLELETALREGFLGGPPGETPLRRSVPLLARTGGALEGDPPAWEVPSWDPADRTESVQDPGGSVPVPRTASPDLDDLRVFLESPYLSRVRGRGWSGPDDDEDEDRSPLFPGTPVVHALCARMVDRIWSDGDAPVDAVDRVLAESAWDEGVPERDFLDAARGRFRTWAETVGPALRDVPGRLLRPRLDLLVGPGDPVSPGDLRGSVRWAGTSSTEIVLADLVGFAGSSPAPEKRARLYLAGALLRALGAGSVKLLWIERLGRGRRLDEPLPVRAGPDWLDSLRASWTDPARMHHLPLAVAGARGFSREAMERDFHDERRHRSDLELLLEPPFPALGEPELLELADRLFAPWRLG
jgi:hypothetical protein